MVVPPAAYMSTTATGLVNPKGFRFSDNTMERRKKNRHLNGLVDPDPPKYNSKIIFDKVLRESSRDCGKMLAAPYMRRTAHQDLEKLYEKHNLRFNRQRLLALPTPQDLENRKEDQAKQTGDYDALNETR
tara:strand:+ start:711 stop:1100 length:390 start_codon:yes stop_codon:yes gene_type:complete